MRRSLARPEPSDGMPVQHTVRTGRLTVEMKCDLDLEPDDAATVDALIEQRPRVGVFLSRAWLAGFFAEPPSGFVPCFALIREGPVVRGVAPLAVRETFTRTYVGLLGGGSGSDRVDLLIERGFEAACSDALLAWTARTFGSKGFIFSLRDVPDDSCLWGAFHRAGAERTLQLALQPSEIHTLPYLSLAGPDRGGSESRPPQPCNSLDKHRRMLERRGRIRIELLKDRAEIAAAFDCLVRFLHDRWKGCGEGSVLDNPRTLRFHRQVLPHLLAEGRLRMIRLSADIRTIAVFYGLASGGWWGYYLAGYDRDWAGRIHLGQITLASAIEMASSEQAVEFDFLKGADRVKYLWPVRERATIDADLYSQRSGAQLRRATRATREAAVALAKSARDLFFA